MTIEKKFSEQVKEGTRFTFGENWNAFLKTLDDERIAIAENSLKEMMEMENLQGKSFLDIGCGSGIFSLSAKNLGASVHSLDFDPSSVGCARFLKEKYHTNTTDWTIEEGSALDTEYIASLGKFDIVYSWGVLHHTGNMQLGLENAILPVKENGILFISIYNEQGWKSRFWLRVKKMYNRGILGKAFIVAVFFPLYVLLGLIPDIFRLRNPFKRYRDYRRERGMSMVHDWHDWLGGLPFEVATPEYLVGFYKKEGFHLEKIKTNNSLGTNQFVFSKTR